MFFVVGIRVFFSFFLWRRAGGGGGVIVASKSDGPQNVDSALYRFLLTAVGASAGFHGARYLCFLLFVYGCFFLFWGGAGGGVVVVATRSSLADRRQSA